MWGGHLYGVLALTHKNEPESSADLDQPTEYESQALKYWGGDPLLAAVMDGDPASDLVSFIIESAGLHRDTAQGAYADFSAARKYVGLEIEDAAEACGVSLVTWLAWEYGWGTHSVAQILMYARQLGMPAGLFFHDRDFDLNPLTRLRRDYGMGE